MAIFALSEQPGMVAGDGSRLFGKYRGRVVDNQDPNGMGRLKAKVPEALGDLDSNWAMPCVPYAGDGIGLYAVPPPGAGVWIEFEAGDVARPVWTGCWWAEGQVPDAASPGLKVLKSEAGHTITLDDDGGTLTLTDAGGAKVVLDQSGIELSKGGQKIKIGDRSISINDGALEIS